MQIKAVRHYGLLEMLWNGLSIWFEVEDTFALTIEAAASVVYGPLPK